MGAREWIIILPLCAACYSRLLTALQSVSQSVCRSVASKSSLGRLGTSFARCSRQPFDDPATSTVVIGICLVMTI